MLSIAEWLLKAVFFFWLTVFGVGIADFAIKLQSETIKSYMKGPVSASKFTRIMTGEDKK